MAQVKKAEVRDAIVAAAHELFRQHSYSGTTLRQIATAADVSLANVYSYFASKLDLLVAISDPWLRDRLEQLERDLEEIKNPRQRLRFIIAAFWREIPAEDNCFANNIMQALSTAQPTEYDARTIEWSKQKLSEMLHKCLPAERQILLADGSCTHLLFMAFDGFSLNSRLNPKAVCTDEVIDLICNLLEGTPPRPPRRVARNKTGLHSPQRIGTAQRKPEKR
ncbi:MULTISPECIES: TetR/AcrR family transcriptional regulator [unclassified Beijerinckia]|uniref:TetR/AcrR family transcriptional regulator n=1 Tax=unclassified Beijerinckia TaxID=2638183 RepID=UPI000894FE7D|nr:MULTISPECIES: TetR/AcrR family transcriptional regulator [unclassified Beijerinckia]MDH7796211.1 AcrR family transcriptional regulator [Beijerinckia sp. GAS462]SEC35247.1 transcriptional regulator, TetR family [Beijerinckia sp. 28-YEA-48]